VHKAHAAGDKNSRATEQPVARSGPVTRVVISFVVPTPAALASPDRRRWQIFGRPNSNLCGGSLKPNACVQLDRK
jgi:hypothetical protein